MSCGCVGENHGGCWDQDNRENQRNPEDPTPADKVGEDTAKYQAQATAHVNTFNWNLGVNANMKPMDPDAPQKPIALAFRAGVGK